MVSRAWSRDATTMIRRIGSLYAVSRWQLAMDGLHVLSLVVFPWRHWCRIFISDLDGMGALSIVLLGCSFISFPGIAWMGFSSCTVATRSFP